MIIAAVPTEVISLVGILLGPAGLIGGYAAMNRLRPDIDSAVMTTTGEGVTVLKNVIDTVTSQWERAEASRVRCEEQVERRDSYIRQLIDTHEEDMREKNALIAELRNRANGE